MSALIASGAEEELRDVMNYNQLRLCKRRLIERGGRLLWLLVGFGGWRRILGYLGSPHKFMHSEHSKLCPGHSRYDGKRHPRRHRHAATTTMLTGGGLFDVRLSACCYDVEKQDIVIVLQFCCLSIFGRVMRCLGTFSAGFYAFSI